MSNERENQRDRNTNRPTGGDNRDRGLDQDRNKQRKDTENPSKDRNRQDDRTDR